MSLEEVEGFLIKKTLATLLVAVHGVGGLVPARETRPREIEQAVLVLIDRTHGVGVLRAQQEDLADLDAAMASVTNAADVD